MEDKYRGERVLVFNKSMLDELGSFNGISRGVEHYLNPILQKENNHFHLRYQAETDASLKQIIPYVIFCWKDQVFSYVRGKHAGESRLVGNRSVGIGGHINPQDEMLFAGASLATDRETYLEAVLREIDEEVIVDGAFEPKIVALINDDSNDVGKVHFGVVHVCFLDSPGVKKREQQITQAGFMPLEELAVKRREELETWSGLCVDLLIEMLK